jgi:hypothetical protein
MTRIITILVGGMVLWWLVNPKNNGVQWFAGMWGNIIAFFRFLLGKPVTGG